MRFAGILIVTLLSAGQASAGLWENIYQGLGYFATPSGSPVNFIGDGFVANGQRAGRLRIVPNRAGQGYRLELDRVFGTDGSGRPEILDLGPYELELSGAVSSTLGYTTRHLPTGNADFAFTDLNYELRGKSGAQDVTLRGTLNGGQNVEINPLGFYTVALAVSNTNSQIELDGVIVDNSSADTDFDIGPISVKGNIYYDLVVGLLGAAGVDTTGLTDLFPASPIDRITQELQAAFGTQVDSVSARVRGGLVSGAGDPGLAAQTQQFLSGVVSSTVASPAGSDLGIVPEPSALVLLTGMSLLLLRRR